MSENTNSSNGNSPGIVVYFGFVIISIILRCTTVSPDENGIYCADITYYNPNTGTKTSFVNSVTVEDGYLIRIDFANGGWLDEDHFEKENFSFGRANITSDKGYKYSVRLKHEGACDD